MHYGIMELGVLANIKKSRPCCFFLKVKIIRLAVISRGGGDPLYIRIILGHLGCALHIDRADKAMVGFLKGVENK